MFLAGYLIPVFNSDQNAGTKETNGSLGTVPADLINSFSRIFCS
jgi:hypothetical protein